MGPGRTSNRARLFLDRDRRDRRTRRMAEGRPPGGDVMADNDVDGWLGRSQHSVTLRPEVVDACRRVQSAANAVGPGLTRDYEITIDVSPESVLRKADPVLIALRER